MSFILDALKKSETDRQRQNGPALFEVRAAPTRDKLPLWAVGLGVLLAVNLVIVAWVLLRRPASAEAAQPAAAAGMQQQSGQGPYGAAGVPQGQQQGWSQGGQGPQGQGMQGQGGQGPQGQGMQGQGMQAQGQQGTVMSQGANGGGPGSYGAAANGGGSGGYGAPANGASPAGYGAPAYGTPPGGPMAQTAGLTAGQQPGMTSGQQAPANGQAFGSTQPQQPGAPVAGNEPSQGGERLNPDDYAPAADPAPQPFGNHVTRSTSSGVPLYNDVASTTRLPSLRLDLHVYAANPQERFVMINMHKLHEGDLLMAEGVRVENITPFGAVLSRDGTKFLLPRD